MAVVKWISGVLVFLILNTYKAVGLLLLRIWSDILGKYRLKGVVLNNSPIQPQSQANYPWYKHSIYSRGPFKVTLVVLSPSQVQIKLQIKYSNRIMILRCNSIPFQNRNMWIQLKRHPTKMIPVSNIFALMWSPLQTKFKPCVIIKLGTRVNLPQIAVRGYQIRHKCCEYGRGESWSSK